MHHPRRPLRQKTRPIKLLLIIQRRNIRMMSKDLSQWFPIFQKRFSLLINITKCVVKTAWVWNRVERRSGPIGYEYVADLCVLDVTRIPVYADAARKRKIVEVVPYVRVDA